MKLKDYKDSDLVPSYIRETLTVKEERELRRAIKRPFTRMEAALKPNPNKGILYLALMSPLKPSVLKSETVDEKTLLDLIAYDTTRQDPLSSRITTLSEGFIDWFQHSRNIINCLWNPNLTKETAFNLLDGTIRSGPSSFPDEAIAKSVGDDILQRPEGIDKISTEVLASLIEIFNKYGLDEHVEAFLTGRSN